MPTLSHIVCFMFLFAICRCDRKGRKTVLRLKFWNYMRETRPKPSEKRSRFFVQVHPPHHSIRGMFMTLIDFLPITSNSNIYSILGIGEIRKKQPKPFWVTHNIPLLLPTKSVPSMCAKIHIDSELVTDSRNGLFTKWMFFLFPRGVTCYKGTEQRDLHYISIVWLSG